MAKNASPPTQSTAFPWQVASEITENELLAWEDLRCTLNHGLEIGAIPESEMDGLFNMLNTMFEHGMRCPQALTVSRLIIVLQDVAEA